MMARRLPDVSVPAMVVDRDSRVVQRIEHEISSASRIRPGPCSFGGPVGDIGELVRRAARENQALYPIGGRTLLNVGLPPARPGTVVDLRTLLPRCLTE